MGDVGTDNQSTEFLKSPPNRTNDVKYATFGGSYRQHLYILPIGKHEMTTAMLKNFKAHIWRPLHVTLNGVESIIGKWECDKAAQI